MSEGRVQISARISPDLAKRIDQATFALGISKNQLIEEALEAYMQRKSVKTQVEGLFKQEN